MEKIALVLVFLNVVKCVVTNCLFWLFMLLLDVFMLPTMQSDIEVTSFISHFGTSNFGPLKGFCDPRQRLFFNVCWMCGVDVHKTPCTGYWECSLRVINGHLQDSAGSWTKTRESSCSLDLEQKCPQLLTGSLQNVTSTKTVKQIVHFIHTHLHKLLVLSVATTLSPATHHNYIYFLLQRSSQLNKIPTSLK